MEKSTSKSNIVKSSQPSNKESSSQKPTNIPQEYFNSSHPTENQASQRPYFNDKQENDSQDTTNISQGYLNPSYPTQNQESQMNYFDMNQPLPALPPTVVVHTGYGDRPQDASFRQTGTNSNNPTQTNLQSWQVHPSYGDRPQGASFRQTGTNSSNPTQANLQSLANPAMHAQLTISQPLTPELTETLTFKGNDGQSYDVLPYLSKDEAKQVAEQSGVLLKQDPANPDRYSGYRGGGYFGRVYVAKLVNSNKYVVVKIIQGNNSALIQSSNESTLQRKLTQAVNAENSQLMPMYDAVEVKENDKLVALYMVLPLAALGSAEDLHKELNSLDNVSGSLRRLLISHLAKGVLIALYQMHKQHIYHLDIHSANIMINDEGKVQLGDFGVSEEVAINPPILAPGINRQGRFIGNGNGLYFPPERSHELGTRQFDPAKSDLYGVGALLWEFITGEQFPSSRNHDQILNHPLLQNPSSNSIAHLAKQLLTQDPNLRPSVEVALNHPSLCQSEVHDQALNKTVIDFLKRFVRHTQRKAQGDLNQQQAQETLQAELGESQLETSSDPFKLNPLLLTPFQSRPDIKEQLATYLPLKGSLDREIKDPTTQTFDLFDQTNKFLSESATIRPLMLLLADGGSGKSLYMQWLTTHLLSNRVISPSGKAYFPLYITLSNVKTPNQLLEEALGLTHSALLELQKTYDIVVLADGFDEQQQWNNLYVQNELNRYEIKLIITCRINALPPSYYEYFAPRVIGENYPRKMYEVYVQPFQPSQIDSYIDKYLIYHQTELQQQVSTNQLDPQQLDANYIKSQVNAITGLKELMQTPFLARLVLFALPNLKLKGSQKITRSYMYEAFIQQWVTLQIIAKPQKSINIDTVINFGQKLALTLYNENRANEIQPGITLYRFDPAKMQYYQLPKLWDWFEHNKFEKSLLPLQEVQKGTYKFVHLSLQEYLLARALYTELIQADVLSDLTWNTLSLTIDKIDRPILYFLGEMAQTDPKFANLLFKLVDQTKTNKSQAQAGANAITVLNASELCLYNRDFTDIDINNADLSGAILWGSTFSGANLTRVNFENANLNSVNLSNANLTDIRLEKYTQLKFESSVSHCIYSNDENYLAVAFGNQVSIHKAHTLELIVNLRDHKQKITSINFSSDSRYIISGSIDKTLKLWDIEKAKLLYSFETNEEVTYCSFAPNSKYLASGNKEGKIKIWDVQNYSLICAFEEHRTSITRINFDKSSKYIVSIDQNTCYVWESETGKKTMMINSTVSAGEKAMMVNGTVHEYFNNKSRQVAPLNCAFQQNEGLIVLVAYTNGQICLWDIETQSLIRTFEINTTFINNCAFDLSEKLVAYSDINGTVTFLDLNSGKQIRQINQGKYKISSCAFNAKSTSIAFGSVDGSIRIWDVALGITELHQYHNSHQDQINSVAIDKSGTCIASVSNDGVVKLWNIVDENQSSTLIKSSDILINSISFSKDNKYIALGSTGIKIFDRITHSIVEMLPSYASIVTSCIFSDDNQYFAYASSNRSVTLCDNTQNLRTIYTFMGHTKAVTTVVFSHDNKYLLSASEDATIKLWDIQTKKELCTYSGHKDKITSISFDKNAKYIVSSSYNKLNLWNVQDGNIIREFVGHESWITGVAFIKGSDYIVSGSLDQSVRIWNTKDGNCCMVLNFTDSVSSVVSNFYNGNELLLVSYGSNLVYFKVDEINGKLVAKMKWVMLGSSQLDCDDSNLSNAIIDPDSRAIMQKVNDKKYIKSNVKSTASSFIFNGNMHNQYYRVFYLLSANRAKSIEQQSGFVLQPDPKNPDQFSGLLGSGAFGKVYVAEKGNSGQYVAVKVTQGEGETNSGQYAVNVTQGQKKANSGQYAVNVTQGEEKANSGQYAVKATQGEEEANSGQYAVKVTQSEEEANSGQYAVKVTQSEEEPNSGQYAVKRKSMIQSAHESFIQAQLTNAIDLNDSYLMPILDESEVTENGKLVKKYIAMPIGLYSGADLCEQLNSLDDTVSTILNSYIAKSILLALQQMHRQHIYHLDLRPANFIITQDGKIKLFDFGCSEKITETPPILTPHLGADGRNIGDGDSNYFPPERKHHGNPFDAAKADIYAVGAILFKLITNQRFETSKNNKFNNPSGNSIKDLTNKLLSQDPHDRPTLEQALNHPSLSNNNAHDQKIIILALDFLKFYIQKIQSKKNGDVVAIKEFVNFILNTDSRILSPENKFQFLLTKQEDWTIGFHWALANGHAAAIKEFMTLILNADSSILTPANKLELLLAKASDGNPDFYRALQEGHADAIKEFVTLILNADNNILTSTNKLELLLAKDKDGTPRFYLTLAYGHTKVIKQFITLILNADNLVLTPTNKLELLLAKDKKGTPGFYWALEKGYAHAIKEFIILILNADNSILTPTNKLELLLAKTSNGTPGFYWAFQKSDASAIKEFVTLILNADSSILTPANKLELLLAKDKEGTPGFYWALYYGHTDVIKEFVTLILNADNSILTPANKLELLLAKRSSGTQGIFMAFQNGHVQAIKEFVTLILNADSSILTPTNKLELLLLTFKGNDGQSYNVLPYLSKSEAMQLAEQSGVLLRKDPANPDRYSGYLGGGHFGRVYVAKLGNSNKYVVVKIIQGNDSALVENSHESTLQRKLTQAVNAEDSQLMPMYDAVEVKENGKLVALYTAMPLAALGSTQDLHKELSNLEKLENNVSGSLRRLLILHIAKGVLIGLYQMHKEHIYHLDLHSANIMITGEGRIQITDFGTSEEIFANPPLLSLHRNQNGRTLGMGAIRYFPPERPRELGVRQFNPAKSDLYGVGALLWEFITGEQFPSSSNHDQILNHPLMQNPNANSISHLARQLLSDNPNSRPSVEAALNHPSLCQSEVHDKTLNSTVVDFLKRFVRYTQRKAQGDLNQQQAQEALQVELGGTSSDPFVLNPTLRAPFENHPDIENQLKTYLPLKGSWYREVKDLTTQTFDLFDQTNKFLSESATIRPLMLLLADGGSGKSLYMQWLTMHLLSNQVISPSGKAYFPLYVTLSNVKTLNQLLKEASGLKPSALLELQKNYDIVVLADGFDEQQHWNNLYVQNELNRYDIKLIITCRINVLPPNYYEYFAPRVAGENYPRKMYEVYVQPFQSSQIDSYIDKYLIHHQTELQQQVSTNQLDPQWLDANYVKAQVNAIPGLNELMQTPRLSRFALFALLQLSKQMRSNQDIQKITRSQVYEAFMQQWIGSQVAKSQKNNQEQDAAINSTFKLGERIALELYQQNRAKKINVGEKQYKFDTTTQKYIQLANTWDWFDQAVSEKSALPLQEAQKGVYKFVHLSMQEYLLARALYTELIQASILIDLVWNKLSLTVDKIDHPVLYFLGEIAQTDPKFADLLFKLVDQTKINKTQAQAGANAITVLNAGGIPLFNRDFTNITIPKANLSGAVLQGSDFTNADLTGINSQGTNWRNAKLVNANISNIYLAQLPAMLFVNAVQCCAYSPDGRCLAAANGSSISIYDIATHKLICELKAHTGWVTSLIFDKSCTYLLSGSKDKNIKLWNIVDKKVVQSFSGHKDSVNSIAFSPSGQHIASGSDDKIIKLWNTKDGKELHSFIAHKNKVTNVTFSLEGKYIISGSENGEIKLWEMENGKLFNTLVGNRDKINSIAVSSQYIASAGDDQIIRLWDINSLILIRSFIGHTGSINSVVFDNSGVKLASGGSDNLAIIWDIESGLELRRLSGHTNAVNSCSFSKDDNYLVTSSNDTTIRVWDISSEAELGSTNYHQGRINNCSFASNGRYIASVSSDQSLRLWDTKHGYQLKSLEHTDALTSCSFSYDGKYIAVAIHNSVIVYETANTNKIIKLDGHSGNISSISFNPNGGLLATGSNDGIIKLWNTNTWNEVANLGIHIGEITSLVFSPNGKYLATGGWDNTVKLYNVATASLIHTLKGHISQIISVTFSPNGKYLASSSRDFDIKLWNLTDGRLIATLNNHTNWVDSITFDPSGSYLASGSSDKTVKIWDIVQKQCIFSLTLAHAVSSLAWSNQASLDYLIVGFGSNLGCFKIDHVDQTLNVQMQWVSGAPQLDFNNTDLSNVVGITQTNWDLAKQLKAIGRPPQEITTLYGYSELYIALENNDIETTKALVSNILSEKKLTPEEKIKQLLAKDKDDNTSLGSAFKNGHTKAIKAFVTLILNAESHILTRANKLELLFAKASNGTPGFCLALENGHVDAIREFVTLILNADNRILTPTNKLELLLAKRSNGTPGFYWALQNGHAGAIKEFIALVLNADNSILTPTNKLELLLAKNSDGTTGFYMALYNHHTDAIDEFINFVYNASPDVLTQKNKIELLLARDKEGKLAVANWDKELDNKLKSMMLIKNKVDEHIQERSILTDELKVSKPKEKKAIAVPHASRDAVELPGDESATQEGNSNNRASNTSRIKSTLSQIFKPFNNIK